MDHPGEQWLLEAQRLHERYLIEVVEACGLCPWAERARRQGRTALSVLLEADDRAFEPAIATLHGWAADPRVEIGFLIFPRLPLGRTEFDRFVGRLRTEEAQHRPAGEAPFALVAFHPDAAPDLNDPERLIPFLRRTPDPCVQVARMSALRRVRSGSPEGTQFLDAASLAAVLSEDTTRPLRERIARANLDTVRRMGLAQFAARIEDIQRDRARTYAALQSGGEASDPSPVLRRSAG